MEDMEVVRNMKDMDARCMEVRRLHLEEMAARRMEVRRMDMEHMEVVINMEDMAVVTNMEEGANMEEMSGRATRFAGRRNGTVILSTKK